MPRYTSRQNISGGPVLASESLLGYGDGSQIFSEGPIRSLGNSSRRQDGGSITPPPGHFTAFITPQESEFLRSQGGGVTPSGGQYMTDGIPTYDDSNVSNLPDPNLVFRRGGLESTQNSNFRRFGGVNVGRRVNTDDQAVQALIGQGFTLGQIFWTGDTRTDVRPTAPAPAPAPAPASAP